VGFYQLIKKILLPIGIVAEPFSMLVYPKLIHFYEKKESHKFISLIFKISLYLFLFALTYILIGYIFSEKIFILVNVKLTSEILTLYGLLSVLMIVTNLLWWARVFSNVVNPKYSLYMNIYATIFQLTITVLAAFIFRINGIIISMILMNISIGFFWVLKLQNYVRKTIYLY
jgi:O-antigen/teichoic acid export membrane protein